MIHPQSRLSTELLSIVKACGARLSQEQRNSQGLDRDTQAIRWDRLAHKQQRIGRIHITLTAAKLNHVLSVHRFDPAARRLPDMLFNNCYLFVSSDPSAVVL